MAKVRKLGDEILELSEWSPFDANPKNLAEQLSILREALSRNQSDDPYREGYENAYHQETKESRE